MTREEAIDCINAIHVQMFNSGNSKWTEACDMAIEALKNIQVLDKIPQNYLYDTEAEHCLVYRHKYTGKEIHILKPTDLFVLERPHGEWKHAIVDCYKSGYICPHCNGFAVIDGKSDGYSVTFCPNCGSNNRPKEGEKNENT